MDLYRQLIKLSTSRRKAKLPLLITMLMVFPLSHAYPYLMTEEDMLLDDRIQGAWKMVDQGLDPRGEMSGWAQIKLISRGYFMFAVFDTQKRIFIAAGGGTYAIRNGKYTEYVLFHTVAQSIVGRSHSFQVRVEGNKFYQRGSIRSGGVNTQFAEEYTRVDYGRESQLVGAWRKQDVQEAYVNSQRKETTMMLLTGKRFQRVVFNSSSKRIVSVIGGSYTFRNNQWVEKQEFNKNSSSSVNRRFSYDSRYDGKRLGIKKRNAYRPETYVRLD